MAIRKSSTASTPAFIPADYFANIAIVGKTGKSNPLPKGIPLYEDGTLVEKRLIEYFENAAQEAYDSDGEAISEVVLEVTCKITVRPSKPVQSDEVDF